MNIKNEYDFFIHSNFELNNFSLFLLSSFLSLFLCFSARDIPILNARIKKLKFSSYDAQIVFMNFIVNR